MRSHPPLFVTFAVILAAIAGAGCEHRGSTRAEALRQRIAEAVRFKRGNANRVSVDLVEITPFEWDRFYVFPPHTTYTMIDESLGFRWPAAQETEIANRDDINLLVFVHNNDVVIHVEHPRVDGDFSKLEPGRGYTPQESHFEVQEENPFEPWLFVLKPNGRSIKRDGSDKSR